MKVYVSLDNVSYDNKPLRDIPIMKGRVSARWQYIEVSALADLVGNKGHAMVPAHMEGGISAKDCTGMQLLALDFDSGITFREVKERCDSLGLSIAFAYHTYSSSGAMEKFRVVFVYEHLLEDKFVIKVMIAMLHKLFPSCDPACKNLDRMFLGGKGLIYLDEGARITFVQLLYPFYQALNTQENFHRNIRSFCNKNRILSVNGLAAMERIELLPSYMEIDGLTDSSIIHTIGEATKPSYFMIECVKGHQSITCTKKLRRLEIKKDCACQLLCDFVEGEILDHHVRFALLTNLLHIHGGKKEFFAVLEKYYDSGSVQKWKKDLIYMKNYLPQHCSAEFCPYYDQCDNAGTIVKTLAMDRRIYREDEEYYTLEESTACLRNNLQRALESIGSGMHLIKAQTGLGKTTAYLQLVKENPGRKFLIALPTNILKMEVAEKLKWIGLEEEIFVTASTRNNPFIPQEVQEEIADAHSRGLHKKTYGIIERYFQEIKEDPTKTAVAEECQRILKGISAVEGERVIVTTHAYFLQMPESFLKSYTIIIDEDILQLQIFGYINSISIHSLNALIEQQCTGYAKIAGMMIRARENEYIKISGSPYLESMTEERMEELGISDNVNDLAFAESFVKIRDRKTGMEMVKYFCPKKLPQLKYIVLSATLNRTIYEWYVGQSMEIYWYPEKKVKYMGRVIQYSYHSLGRRDLLSKKQVFSFARKKAQNPLLEIITFKQGPNFNGIPNSNTKGLHFGNTTGVNILSGRDLATVGTPFKAEEAYKLIACYLGADVNRKDDERPRLRRVSYKGCNFLFVTYSDQLLREVQLYSIESELEQCIGRARLLRNDCTVYVFSSFPCEQAELKMQNYLLDMPCG